MAESEVESVAQSSKSSSPVATLSQVKEQSPCSGPSRSKSRSPTSMNPTTISFFSGNPSVEVTDGIMHICTSDNVRDTVDKVCILSTPCTLLTGDLLHFLGPVRPDIRHIRIIRDRNPNQYMVLIIFQSPDAAEVFYQSYNNTPFNSIESHICHMLYVDSVDVMRSSQGESVPIYDYDMHEEPPTCPVCLEKMLPSADAILTVLCNHSFHASCLAKWDDSSCPVCRYVQTPEAVADNKCNVCGAQENLWICLVCGHVGCGRYMNRHAHAHFVQSGHTYSLQVGGGRVWDYAADNYVHRLVQNKGDGKLVEIEGGAGAEQKVDSIVLEYTHLLTSQLDDQRRWFEERLAVVEKDAEVGLEHAEARAHAAAQSVESRQAEVDAARKERHVLEKRLAQVKAKYEQVLRAYSDDKLLNGMLRENQPAWKEKIARLERDLESRQKTGAALQEELSKLMTKLELESDT